MKMIRLTRINHVPLVLNSDLIEHVEATPDTVIALTTGQKLVVLESAEEVIQRVIEFRRAISNQSQFVSVRESHAATETASSEPKSELWPVQQLR